MIAAVIEILIATGACLVISTIIGACVAIHNQGKVSNWNSESKKD